MLHILLDQIELYQVLVNITLFLEGDARIATYRKQSLTDFIDLLSNN